MKKQFFATTAIAIALAFAIPAPVQALELGVGGKSSVGGIVGGMTRSTESVTTSVHGATDTDINGVTTTETTTQATTSTDLGVGNAVGSTVSTINEVGAGASVNMDADAKAGTDAAPVAEKTVTTAQKKKIVRHRKRDARPAEVSTQTQETVKSTTTTATDVNANARIDTNADINTNERNLLGGRLRTDGNVRVNK